MSMAKLMDNYGMPPVMFMRGAGAELWDERGKRYLDFLCGLAVTSLGHAHPAVTAAVAAQAAKLTHVSNLFANQHTDDVVRTLDHLLRDGPVSASVAGQSLSASVAGQPGRILFQNSGAEAIEAAIKLVRKYQGRGRHTVVSARGSFHGRTLAALAATGQPHKHEPFEPMPEGFLHVPFNDVEALEAACDSTVGAVLLEPVQGEGGVRPADDAYLTEARRLCDERGALLVIDEIQTGLARTGRWFGYHHAGVHPDIVVMAKALGNGVPVGAVWARPDVAAAFGPGDHGSTFAGQPLVLATVRSVLDALVEMDAPAVSHRLGSVLTGMLERLEGVDHVRGLGLLLGVEISQDALSGRTAKEVASVCLERGLVVNGVTETALRIAPPLVVSEAQLEEAVAIVASVLECR